MTVEQEAEEVRRLRAIVAGTSLSAAEDAAVRLAALGAPGALEALFDVVARGCGFETPPRADTVTALARFGERTAEEALRRLRRLDETEAQDLAGDSGDMADEYWRLRDTYCRILVSVGEPAVPLLLETLRNPGGEVRALAAEALAEIAPSSDGAGRPMPDRE